MLASWLVKAAGAACRVTELRVQMLGAAKSSVQLIVPMRPIGGANSCGNRSPYPLSRRSRTRALIYLNDVFEPSSRLPSEGRHEKRPNAGSSMLSAISADELLRSARDAAGTPNVRQAVRELTLHALRGRCLTASHIATVARTVGEGIGGCGVAVAAPGREVCHEAWAGLEEALDRALYALELAAREFADGRAGASPTERDQLLSELQLTERFLATGWGSGLVVPAALQARIATLKTLLQQGGAGSVAAAAGHEAVSAPDRLLSFVASGILVGLSTALREVTAFKGH